MFRVGLLLASCASVCGCAAQTSSQPVPPGSAQQTKRVCTSVEDQSTGTLIGSRQVCEDVPVEPTTTPQR